MVEDALVWLYFADSASESYTKRLYPEDWVGETLFVPAGENRFYEWLETAFDIRPSRTVE